MRRRGCLISFGVLAGLSLLCCVLLIFVGLPRFQDSITDGIADGLSTQVAEQLGAAGDLQPGTHVISVQELERQLQETGAIDNTDDFGFSAQNGEIVLSIGAQGQELNYSGIPVAQDGRLVMTDVEVDAGFLDRLLPADNLAAAVEDGVNDYFTAQGLSIESVTAENDELTIQTVATGQ